MLRTLIITVAILTSCNSKNESISDEELIIQNDSTEITEVDSIIKKQTITFSDTMYVKYHDPFSDSLYYKEDTILSTSRLNVFLAGTDILPITGNQLDARRFNIFLDDLTSYDCIDHTEVFDNKIVSVLKKGDKIIVTIKVQSNCCYQFLGDIGVYNDSTLNLIYIDYGDKHCACNCIYDLTYSLSTNQYNEEGIIDLKAFVINNDFSTLKKY